jgi:hypothetical protein
VIAVRKDPNPAKTAAREAGRARRLGPDAACRECGENRHPALLEVHHPAGRAHDSKFTVPQCRTCHAIATDDQIREEIALGPQLTPQQRHVARLRAYATYHRTAAESDDRAADELEELFKTLGPVDLATHNTKETQDEE